MIYEPQQESSWQLPIRCTLGSNLWYHDSCKWTMKVAMWQVRFDLANQWTLSVENRKLKNIIDKKRFLIQKRN